MLEPDPFITLIIFIFADAKAFRLPLIFANKFVELPSVHIIRFQLITQSHPTCVMMREAFTYALSLSMCQCELYIYFTLYFENIDAIDLSLSQVFLCLFPHLNLLFSIFSSFNCLLHSYRETNSHYRPVIQQSIL
jgi:hypothetical protein